MTIDDLRSEFRRLYRLFHDSQDWRVCRVALVGMQATQRLLARPVKVDQAKLSLILGSEIEDSGASYKGVRADGAPTQ